VRRRRCIQPKKSGSELDSFGVAFMVALRSTPRGGHVDTNAKSTPRRRGNDEPKSTCGACETEVVAATKPTIVRYNED
jgi:hypothetical protein